MTGPLHGIRVFDLSRILAGPTCTQVLGDLGADVIKIEKPGSGDDTRRFTPPFLRGPDGAESTESAYFASANRNKRSVTLDLTQPDGQDVARRLIARCDVLVENFKVGNLAKFGLAYGDVKDDNPRLVYCSITGFGQTGPYATRPGYDFLIQGMGGLMSLTGEPEGEPMKVGVPIADLIAGLYAAIAINAALRHREITGEGQYIDIGMLDTQVATLSIQGLNYLTSHKTPDRLGNAHPNIVPYQVFSAADGDIILTVGNDAQFQRFCAFAGAAQLATDERFRTNDARVKNRDALTDLLKPVIARHPSRYWLEGLERVGVSCGPINPLDRVFADPHVKARGMEIELPHPATGGNPVHLIASPIRMSATPPSYRHAPPSLGESTDEVLRDLLELNDTDIARLRERGVI